MVINPDLQRAVAFDLPLSPLPPAAGTSLVADQILYSESGQADHKRTGVRARNPEAFPVLATIEPEHRDVRAGSEVRRSPRQQHERAKETLAAIETAGGHGSCTRRT